MGLDSSRELSNKPEEPMSSAQLLILKNIQATQTVFDTKSVSMYTYTSSLLYLVYWYHRSQNNPQKQQERYNDIVAYIGDIGRDSTLIHFLTTDASLGEQAKEYIKNTLKPTPTVDLVIMRKDHNKKEQILTIERQYYPIGTALPGGIVRDDDESNIYDIPETIFASLRITSEKIFHSQNPSYGIREVNGKKYYFVQSTNPITNASNEARIFFEDAISYRYRDRLAHITTPSDPRHIVDTTAYKIEIVSGELSEYNWVDSDIFTHSEKQNNLSFVFSHHKEIVAHIIAQSTEIPETSSTHHEWIRQIISNPRTTQETLRQRFYENDNNPNTSVPELYPLVETMRSWIFSDRTEESIRLQPALGVIREQLGYKLDHITIRNGLFCPYATTIGILFEAIAFFDVCRRGEASYSTHFQKKYWHRYHDLISKIPDLLLIPTPENISATDLMRIRGTSLGFIGLSADSIYVDEFWQSPLEFLIHDLNHFWKMRDADEKYILSHPGETFESLYARSNEFGQKYLDSIKIQKSDTKEEREIKKLKKIILFEVIHEDARPFLPDVIIGALLESEGYPVDDDMVDYKNGKPVRVQHTYKGITALSYVRHKLQHGFFDQTDSQNINIVDPDYRSVAWIVRVAKEILHELGAIIPSEIESEGIDVFLSRQAASRGPDILQQGKGIDPAVSFYGDGSYEGIPVARKL